MGRPAKFDTEQILNATANLLAEKGPERTTVAEIALRMGAPTGSIYHRFESRDLLLARVWVRTAQRSQQGFLDALRDDDPRRAAVNGALHVPRWARANLDEATVMVLYRREDLAATWPEQLGDELADLNTGVTEALKTFARRVHGRASRAAFQVTTFALIDIPYAAVRRYLLAGEPPPPSVDELVAKAALCALDLPADGPT